MQRLPVFKVVNPLSLQKGNFYIVSQFSVKINMTLVTTVHSDINAKEKINFDLYKSDGQKQYSILLLTGPARNFFLK